MDFESQSDPPPLRVFRADPRSAWKLYVAAAVCAPLFLVSAMAVSVVAFDPKLRGDFRIFVMPGVMAVVFGGFVWFFLSHTWCNRRLGVVVRPDSVTLRQAWPYKEKTYALAALRCVDHDPDEGWLLLRQASVVEKPFRHGILVSPELFASSAEQQEFIDLMNDLIRRSATSPSET